MTTDRLPRLTPDQLGPEQAELYDAIVGGPRASGPQHFALTDETGALHGPFSLMLHAPGVGGPLQELGAAIRFRASLSARIRELAILQVAVVTRSEFEWYAHIRVGQAAGLSTQELADPAEGTFSPADPAEQAANQLCMLLLADAEIAEDRYTELRHALGERAMLELVVLIGYYRTLASMPQIFAVTTPVDDRTGTLPGLPVGADRSTYQPGNQRHGRGSNT